MWLGLLISAREAKTGMRRSVYIETRMVKKLSRRITNRLHCIGAPRRRPDLARLTPNPPRSVLGVSYLHSQGDGIGSDSASVAPPGHGAWFGVTVARYAFPVRLFHSRLRAGLPAH